MFMESSIECGVDSGLCPATPNLMKTRAMRFYQVLALLTMESSSNRGDGLLNMWTKRCQRGVRSHAS
jgi:hypothetical protein